MNYPYHSNANTSAPHFRGAWSPLFDDLLVQRTSELKLSMLRASEKQNLENDDKPLLLNAQTSMETAKSWRMHVLDVTRFTKKRNPLWMPLRCCCDMFYQFPSISCIQFLGADFRAWLLGNSKQPKMTIDEDRLSQVFGLLLHFPHRDSRSHQKQLHEFSSKASLWEKFPSRSLPKKSSIRGIDCSEFRKNDKQDVAECFLL